jgi:hypothetical protein
MPEDNLLILAMPLVATIITACQLPVSAKSTG